MSDSETTSRRTALEVVPKPVPSDTEQADRVATFTALLNAHRGERHIVALQDYPDPDAISAALAYP